MARKRSVSKELMNLLEASPRPIYVLDDRRRIVYCNGACCAWLDTSPENLVGRQCNYSAGSAAPGDLAAALCPPPEVFRGACLSAELVCLVAANTVSRRLASFSPLSAEPLEPIGVIAVVEISEAAPGTPVETAADESLHQRLQALAVSLRNRYRTERLVGDSASIARVRDQVGLAIAGRGRVAISGGVGSGCENVARTIHSGENPAAAGPLMPLSCDLMDAELLQTTVMAFLRRCLDVEASRLDQGRGEAASSEPPAAEIAHSARQAVGTLLLLDVDKLSLDAQLEMMAFFELPVFNLRTIVTSQRRLLELAAQGQFHPPLALAFSTLEIVLPPLSERRQDIPFLAQQFVEDFNSTGGRQLSGLTTDALDQLCALPWNGDVDELADIIHCACQAADGPRVGLLDLPKRVTLLASAAAHPPPPQDETIQLDEFLAEIEGELISRAMERTEGNKSQAARLLGVTRARLLRKLGPSDQPIFVEQPDDDPAVDL